MEPKLCVATKAFLVHNGKVLIIRESGKYDGGVHVGEYDFPGGKLEPGERFDDALRREIREETGLTSVIIGKPIEVLEWRPLVHGQPLQIVGTIFLCTTDSSDVILGNDHDDFQWINPKEYKNYPIIKIYSSVFEAFLQNQ